jgi:pimeloyl-ACP methyl ester carboxylesterase
MTHKPKSQFHATDVRGFSRLVVDAAIGVTNAVEVMHHNIMRTPFMFDRATHAPAPGITGFVYDSIRGVTRLAGGGIDAVMAVVTSDEIDQPSSSEREALLAALNGVVGHHLADTGNPLAIPMRLRHGESVDLQAGADAVPASGGKILLLVHGLGMNDRQWRRKGHEHGAALAGDLGYSPVYVHYNSGLHISTNGEALAGQLEDLLEHWPVPVEELVIIGHSMGGLVARSACYYGARAGHTWLHHLRGMVFLGTPHHGAPLERGGNWIDIILGASPYSAALARLGQVRSAGVTDLRYGSLRHEDWANGNRFARTGDQRQPVPLPEGVLCYAIAATTSHRVDGLKTQLLGDGLVPLNSALGYHKDPDLTVPFPPSQQWIAYTVSHLDLLHRREVYEQVRMWLAA